jgi:hypothetical protein
LQFVKVIKYSFCFVWNFTEGSVTSLTLLDFGEFRKEERSKFVESTMVHTRRTLNAIKNGNGIVTGRMLAYQCASYMKDTKTVTVAIITAKKCTLMW